MEKRRVFVERFADDDRPFRREDRHRKEDRRHDDHRVHMHRPHREPRFKMTTKLLTSKEDLVEYVNRLGEEGHNIDIFKIEDGLYKVVVKEKPRRPLDEEIEIEVE